MAWRFAIMQGSAMGNFGDHDLTLALSGYANHRELNRDSLVRA
jgi:hypothetical protein